MLTAEYVALLRRDAGRVVTEPQPYRTALGLIRQLVLRRDRLTAEDLVDEISAIFDALAQVQAELDAHET